MRINDKANKIDSEFELDDKGYLIAKGVKLAVTDALDYTGDEIGQEKGKLFKVGVDQEVLFDQKTIDSFEGVPVTLIHPKELEVKADTWKKHAIGHAQNIRAEGKFLMGDLYISDAEAIQKIDKEKIKEISLGYDCDLVIADSQDSDFKKTNIKGNHVAIVPSGRCGGSCRLGDKKGTNMSKTLVDSFKKLLGLVKVNDDGEAVAELEKLLEDLQKQLTEAEALPDDQKDQAKIDVIKAQIEDVKQKLEAAKPAQTANDDDLNGEDLEALKKRNQELEQQNAELKAELEKLKEQQAAGSALNDAKARFPKTKIGDASTARKVQEAVLIDHGIYSKDQIGCKSDTEITGAYAALCATSKRNNSMGKALIGDAKPTGKIDFTNKFGGK